MTTSVAIFVKGMEPKVSALEGSESLTVRLSPEVTLYGTRGELLDVLVPIVAQVTGSPVRDLSGENEALRHELLEARSQRVDRAITEQYRPQRWQTP